MLLSASTSFSDDFQVLARKHQTPFWRVHKHQTLAHFVHFSSSVDVSEHVQKRKPLQMVSYLRADGNLKGKRSAVHKKGKTLIINNNNIRTVLRPKLKFISITVISDYLFSVIFAENGNDSSPTPTHFLLFI